MTIIDELHKHFHSKGVILPQDALEIFGDMNLSDYVEALESFGVDRERIQEQVMTHEEIVDEHLKQVGPLSQQAAALLYRMWRLSAVIKEYKKTLAKQGKFEIHTELFPTKRGGRYAVYSLVKIKGKRKNN